MLSIETESKLAEIFLRISESERSVEECRYYLSNMVDFDPYSAFRGVDRLGIGFFSSTELLSLLDKHRFFSSTDEIYLAIKQYDSNLDGRLSIEEFFSLVLPSTNPSLKALAMSRRGYFTPEIEYSLVRLLQAEITYHRNLESAKRTLMLRHDFTMTESFRTIDIRNLGFIDRITLLSFLQRHKNINEEDIDTIFRRLDNDGDNVLSYQEFVESIMPAQVNAFSNYRQTSPTMNYRQNNQLYREPISQLSLRRTSPLRNSSMRESFSSSNLRKSFNNTSPLRNSSTLQNQTYSKNLRSEPVLNLSPRRSSPLRSSPLRSSPIRSSQIPKATESFRESIYKTSSPLRTSNLNVSSRSFIQNPNLTSNTYQNQSIQRESSPLRTSSPLRKSFADRSGFNETGGVNSSRSRFATRPNSLEESELVNWFQEEIKISRDIERKKNELSLKHDFNLIDAFKMFDINDFGAISIGDFEDTFRYFAFNAPRDEIFLLIKHYSNMKNTRLTFADFSDIFSPKQDEYARILRNRSASSNNGYNRFKVFSRDTTELFLQTFRLIFDAESLAERVRQRLSRIPEFNLHQAFVAVDKNRNGFITIDEFQSILQNNGIFATNGDLKNLLQKYDKDKDGRVSYNEFVEEVTPKSPKRF
ncbi:hypothetical protein SteCoe_22800 [Stentor coeruleus]|uniref:EF-hand domain-containing protein n=1 Tax=Stentor coeruleus TaxID=5963 RepID=A0A1R2BLH1_9CILI|nr:hypothetical protein SteCoe_22800 [Stentor coeruleus]